MIVWVAWAIWDYEDERLLGVFSSKEKALEALETFKSAPNVQGYPREQTNADIYDSFFVQQYEVDA